MVLYYLYRLCKKNERMKYDICTLIRLHVLGKVVIRLQSYERTLIFDNYFANYMMQHYLKSASIIFFRNIRSNLC